MQASPERWAHESFSRAEFGDARRSRRFVRLMAGVAREPSGRVTQVFSAGGERQAAYDFLEHDAAIGRTKAGHKLSKRPFCEMCAARREGDR